MIVPLTTTDLLDAEYFTDTAQPSFVVDELTLRPWSADDAPAVFEAFEDSGIQRWHARIAVSMAEVRAWLEAWAKAWNEAAHANWAVIDTDTGTLVGRASLRDIRLTDGQAAAAYWTVPAARGRGVAPRAVAALTDWALNQRGFHRIELEHSVRNTQSCRVAAKLGFALEGTRRSAGLHADGWHDMHLHARIRGD